MKLSFSSWINFFAPSLYYSVYVCMLKDRLVFMHWICIHWTITLEQNYTFAHISKSLKVSMWFAYVKDLLQGLYSYSTAWISDDCSSSSSDKTVTKSTLTSLPTIRLEREHLFANKVKSSSKFGTSKMQFTKWHESLHCFLLTYW